MKVHLIRSEEISTRRFRTIAEIIAKFKGAIEFIFNEDDIADEPEDIGDDEGDKDITGDNSLNNQKSALDSLSWSTLFSYCEDFRKKNKKVKDDELVILFTDHGNERNWFSSWDESGRLNFFIQTSGWDNFIESEECYPVIYELATIPLILATCKDLKEVETMAHDSPRGCPFDYCRDKTQVQLRLRTGDICSDCRKIMIEKNIDPALARQVFAILDDIRSQMLFRNQFGITKQLSRIKIDKFNRNLHFTDIRNISLHLTDREITVYLFFLDHPEGIAFKHMPKYRGEIENHYRNFADDANLPKFNNVLDNIITSKDTLSWIIHQINKKIVYTVGPELADNYTINRKPRFKKDGKKAVEYDHFIPLDRNLVTIDSNLFST